MAMFAVVRGSAAQAGVWQWDGNDLDNTVSVGVAQGGTGVWNVFNTNWYVGPNVAYDPNFNPIVNLDWENTRGGQNIAMFGGVGGTVTLEGGNTDRVRRHAVGLLFTVGGYTLSPGFGTSNDRVVISGPNAIELTSGVTFGNDVILNNGISLAGASTFTNNGAGTLFINGGVTNQTVHVSDLTIEGTGAIALGSNVSTGAGKLIKNGTGTLFFNAAQGYTGETTVNGGTLRYGIVNAISSGPVTVNDGATLDLLGFSDTVGTLTLNRGGVISGTTGRLTTGAGGLISNGGNITGFTTGGVTLGGALTYNTSGGTETTLNIGGMLDGTTFNIADGAQSIDVDITGGLGIGTARNIVKNGAGTMRVSGATSSNLVGGTTTVNDGMLLLNLTGGATNALGSGAITIGDNSGAAGSAILRYATGSNNNQIQGGNLTVQSDGWFDLNNHSETIAGALVVNAGGQVSIGSGNFQTGAATINGTLSATGLGTYTSTAGITLNSGGSLTTAGGAVSGTTVAITGSTLATSGGNFTGTSLTLHNGGSLTTAGGAVSGGTVIINSGGNLASGGGNVTSSALTLNTGGSLSTGGGSLSGTGLLTVNDSFSTSGGNISGFNSLSMTGGTVDSGAGTFTLGGTVTSVASATTSLITGNLDLGSATRGFTVNDGSAFVDLRIMAPISGGAGAGLTKSGPGTLFLQGNNTYSGLTTVSAGTLTLRGNNSGAAGGVTLTAGALNIDSANALGTGTLTIAAGTIDNTSGLDVINANNNLQTWSGNFSFTGTNDLNLGNGAVTLAGTAGSRTVTTTGGTLTVGGAIGGAYGLTKAGEGTLVLKGTNTYTLATAVNAGTLVLDYSSNDASKLSNTAGLTLSASTLSLKGGTHLEVVSATTLTSNRVSTLNRIDGGAKLQMGAITVGAGSSINFGSDDIATTTAAVTNGILGNYATVGGADWATKDGGNNVLAYNGYTDVTGVTPTIVHAPTTNVRVNLTTPAGNVVLGSANTIVNTLLVRDPNPRTIDIGTGNTLGLGVSGGILIPPTTQAVTVGVLGSPGTLTAGGSTANAAGTLYFTNNSPHDLTINSVISNHGTGIITPSINGTGRVVLTNTNSYTGATYISNGVTVLAANGALGSATGVTTVAPGATVLLPGVNYGTAEGLTLNGIGNAGQNGALVSTASSTYAGLITLGGATTISSDAGTLNLSNPGTTTGAGLSLTLTGNGDGVYAGIIGNTTGGLIKNGAGKWTLNGANTYTGATTIHAGTLTLGSATALGPAANANVIFGESSSGILQLNGNNSTIVGLNSNAIVGTPIIESGSNAAGTDTLTVNNASASTYAGILRDGSTRTLALTKAAAGALTLSGNNTYSGPTTVNAGSLILSGNNSLSGLTTLNAGALTLAGDNSGAGGVTLTTGTLNINHAGGLGTGMFTINGGTINNTSGNPISVLGSPAQTWGGNFAFTGASNLDLGNGAVTLTGDRSVAVNGSTLTVGGSIGGGVAGLTKTGVGTLVLNGNNTFTGNTSVSAGTLSLGGTNASLATSITLTGALNLTASNVLNSSNSVTMSGTTSTLNLGNTNQTISSFSTTSTGGGITGTGTLNADTFLFNQTVAGTPSFTANLNAGTSYTASNTLGTVTLSGNLGGAGATLAKSGAGALVLSGNNTYTGQTTLSAGTLTLSGNHSATTGGVTVDAGTLNINHAGALGQGPFTLNAGTFNNNSGSAVTLSTNPTIAWNADFTFAGTNSLNLGNGAISINNNRSITVTANTLTAGGGLSGTGFGLTKAGNGTLVLSGNNTFTGPVTVSGGTLNLGDHAYTGLTSIGAGALVLSGNRTAAYTDQISLTSGSSTLTLLGNNSNFSGSVLVSAAGRINFGNANALGTASLTSNNPFSFDNVSGAPLTLNRTGTMTWNGASQDTLTFIGTNNLNLGSGDIVLGGTTPNQRHIAITNPNATLTIDGNISGGSRGFALVGNSGRLVLNGNNTFTGDTHLQMGTLEINGSHASQIHVRYSTTEGRSVLTGHGSVAGIYSTTDLAGALNSPNPSSTEDRPASGLVSPGPNIGILTSSFVRPLGGLDFAFEFTGTGSPNYGSAANSINDVLRITQASAFQGFSFDASNNVDIYFKMASLSNGDSFRGGFYTNVNNPYSSIAAGSYRYFVLGDGNGSFTFNGNNYYSLYEYAPSATVLMTTIQETANFGAGDINGFVTQWDLTMDEDPVLVMPIPEPGTLTPLVVGSLALVKKMRRRREATRRAA